MTIAPTGGVGVEVHVDSASVELLLTRLETALSPLGLGVYMEGVDEYLRGRIRSRFASEGDDVSGPWAALKEATVTMREEAGYPGDHPINRRTGEMYDYLTSGPARITLSSMGASYQLPSGGSALAQEKVAVAQRGSAGPPTVPRPVLGMNEKDLAVLLTMFGGHLNEFPGSSVFGAALL